jgi:hypothetical protein
MRTRESLMETSVLCQKFVDEISPCSGRHNVAHGASGGSERPPLPPAPSPAQAGEEDERGRGPESHGLSRGLHDVAPNGASEIPLPL